MLRFTGGAEQRWNPVGLAQTIRPIHKISCNIGWIDTINIAYTNSSDGTEFPLQWREFQLLFIKEKLFKLDRAASNCRDCQDSSRAWCHCSTLLPSLLRFSRSMRFRNEFGSESLLCKGERVLFLGSRETFLYLGDLSLSCKTL